MNKTTFSCVVSIPTLGSDLEALDLCLESLSRQKFTSNIKILTLVRVVLNTAEPEAILAVVRKHSDHLKIEPLVLGRNYGFARATNVGFFGNNLSDSSSNSSSNKLEHDYYITLNDDAFVDENFLNEMVERQLETGAEMIASKIFKFTGSVDTSREAHESRVLNGSWVLNGSQHQQIDSCGFDFTWRGKALPNALNGRSLISPLSNLDDNWQKNLDFLNNARGSKLESNEPFGPDAAAALYTKELIARTGGFNESFFAYLEDVDLALRARLLGMGCAFAPKAIAYHKKHNTSSKMGSFKARQDIKNWWRIVTQSYPRIAWRKYGALILLERLKNLKGLFA